MPRDQFDLSGFYAALDAQRVSKKLTWKKVAEASGVSASTLTRMAQGKRPDVDGLAALLKWSCLDVTHFIEGTRPDGKPEPLAMISTHLRADRNLTPEAATALEEVIKATYKQLKTT